MAVWTGKNGYPRCGSRARRDANISQRRAMTGWTLRETAVCRENVRSNGEQMKFVKSFLTIFAAYSIIASKSFAQEWEFERDTDPISDSQNVVAALAASLSSDFGDLAIRCLQNDLEVLIIWAPVEAFDSESADYGIDVITRLDQEDPITSTWQASSDLSATFSLRPEAFIRKLPNHDQLVARTTTTFGISTLIFDLTQAGPVVGEVFEACDTD